MKIGDIVYVDSSMGIISDISHSSVHIRFRNGKVHKYRGKELNNISYNKPIVTYAPKRARSESQSLTSKKQKHLNEEYKYEDSDEEDSEDESKEEGLYILLVCSLVNRAMNCIKIQNLLYTILHRKLTDKDKVYLINPNPYSKNPLSQVSEKIVSEFNKVFDNKYTPKIEEEWNWIPGENLMIHPLNGQTDVSMLLGHPYDIVIFDDCVMYSSEAAVESYSPFFKESCVNTFNVECIRWLDKIVKEDGKVVVSGNIKVFYDGKGNRVNEYLDQRYGDPQQITIEWLYPKVSGSYKYYVWNNK